MKRETQGVDPKVPIQAVVAAVVAVLAYFGLNVDPVVAGTIGTVLGLVAGYFSPAPKVVTTTTEPGA